MRTYTQNPRPSDTAAFKVRILDTRLSLPFPIRAYVHQNGYETLEETATRSGPVKILPWQIAHGLFVESLSDRLRTFPEHYLQLMRKIVYAIAVYWGDKSGERKIDFSGFSDVGPQKWPGNPDVVSLILRAKGLRSPEKLETIVCGDGLVLLGNEEKHRRICSTLEEYMSTWPDLGTAFEPKTTVQVSD